MVTDYVCSLKDLFWWEECWVDKCSFCSCYILKILRIIYPSSDWLFYILPLIKPKLLQCIAQTRIWPLLFQYFRRKVKVYISGHLPCSCSSTSLKTFNSNQDLYFYLKIIYQYFFHLWGKGQRLIKNAVVGQEQSNKWRKFS